MNFTIDEGKYLRFQANIGEGIWNQWLPHNNTLTLTLTLTLTFWTFVCYEKLNKLFLFKETSIGSVDLNRFLTVPKQGILSLAMEWTLPNIIVILGTR